MSALQGLGVSLLMALADPDLRPPRTDRGIPGMVCTERDVEGTAVLIDAVGYPCADSAHDALARARQVLEDAGMVVDNLDYPVLEVRRR